MKTVWLRNEKPKERLSFGQVIAAILFAAFFIWFVYTLATVEVSPAQMCGDCNNDHKVEVSELVKAVSNALTGDPCHEGCADDCFNDQGNCPCNSCFEFPVVDGVRCFVSICNDSPEQVRACHARFYSEHPTHCISIGGNQ